MESAHYLRMFTVSGLLLLMFLLSGGAARRESVTIDEVAHTAAGVSYLQQLDMRMNEEHPPLAKVIAALPLVLRGVHADYTHISWTFSEKMFHQYLGEWVFGHWFLMRWNDPVATMFWARLPMLLATLLLGFVVYKVGECLGGYWGGLLCLCAYVAMPPILAFAPLVITDIVISLFWLLTVWQLPELWRSPSRATLIKFGLTFAGALLSKFSSGLLLIVFPAVALSLWVRPVPEEPAEKPERKAWRKRARRNFLKGTAWAALFVYLVYLILSWNQPTDTFDVIPHFPASALLRRLLMPAWVFLRGLTGFAMSAGSRPTYILGHSYPHGVWFYFPVIFFLKTPLAFLLLLGVSIALAVAVKVRPSSEFPAIPRGRELHWRCLWVSLFVYTAACLLSRLDLSIRHFLVPLVLIILLLAPLPRLLASIARSNVELAKAGASVSATLAIAMLVTAILAYPNFFPFLNALGHRQPGYNLVNDSNLDWNQSLPEVETFVLQRGIRHVLLDEYSFSEPYVYLPQAKEWNCQEPSDGDAGAWAVVSANNIRDARNCRWLLHYPHYELAGGSMFAFQLPASIPSAGTADGPPLPKDYHYFGGIPAFDPKDVFLGCIRDPQQLQPTMDRIMATMKDYNKKK